ncbi:class I SAM-dependent methyltransferase [bacterium]|nr:MAG: class I SAM-dependent methyltransferase [bacterium]
MAFYSDFAGHYETVFPFRTGTAAFLQKWLPDKGRVLDVGCGTGAYTRHLKTVGRHGMGVDLDPGMIAQAQQADPGGDYRIMGMEDLEHLEAGSFSGIFCIGNVLPHLPAEQVATFLGHVHRLLEPQGRWLLQTVNFDPLLERTRYDFPVIGDQVKGIAFHRSYRDIVPGRLEFATSLEVAGEVVFQASTTLYPRTSGDYRSAHTAAGFKPLVHVADWSERRFLPGTNSGSIFVWERP